MDRVTADGRLPVPNLDDRRFQDLVEQAMRLRDQRCPEWNSREPGDPGVTLIEIFAFLVDQLLYRLNQVPDRMYSAFLNMVGIRTHPGSVARTRVDFLPADLTTPIRIPRGTAVSTATAADAAPVTFRTLADATLRPTELRWLATESDGEASLRDGPDIAVAAGERLALGFTEAGAGSLVRVRMDVAGIAAADLLWSSSISKSWSRVGVLPGERPDEVLIDTGSHWAPRQLAGVTGYWIRVGSETQPIRVAVREAVCVGVAVDAHHATAVGAEPAGTGDGRPRQRFRTSQAPLLPNEIRVLVGGTEWRVVESLVTSGPDDRHVEVDTTGGEIQFGDGVHGAIPAAGDAIVVDYLTGGGVAGNVAANTLTVLRDEIAGVVRVRNRLPATGGMDPEPVEEARRQAPAMLRSGWRAVSPDDFERLALQATPLLARARCIPVGAGRPRARLLMVPYIGPEEEFAALGPANVVFENVRRIMEERRVVGMSLMLDTPPYIGVRVVASVTANRTADPDQVRGAAEAAARTYLHPVTGGRDGRGWVFGRPLVAGELFGVLLGVAGVDVVDELAIFPADPVTGEVGKRTDRIELPSDGLLWPVPAQVKVTLA